MVGNVPGRGRTVGTVPVFGIRRWPQPDRGGHPGYVQCGQVGALGGVTPT